MLSGRPSLSHLLHQAGEFNGLSRTRLRELIAAGRIRPRSGRPNWVPYHLILRKAPGAPGRKWGMSDEETGLPHLRDAAVAAAMDVRNELTRLEGAFTDIR